MSTVSVVVPIYNRTCYLPDTLNSLIGQTHADWACVMVDDGSTEDVASATADVVDARFRLLRQTNQGNAAARNAGIAAMQSTYVACLDSDDVWEPTFLATCVAALDARPDVDVVYTQVRAIDGQGNRILRPLTPPPAPHDMLAALLMGYPILPSSAVVRRTAVERWGGFTLGLDDWELWLRWAAAGASFYHVRQPLLNYRLHADNLNRQWSVRREAHFAMLDAFYRRTDLPARAAALRDRAYAQQHLAFALLAWELGMTDTAVEDFRAGMWRDPQRLTDLDLYYRIACANRVKRDRTGPIAVDWTFAETAVFDSLNHFFAQPDLPERVQQQRRAAFGTACLALARVAYAESHDMARVRRYLRKALTVWPAVVWRTDWGMWLLRVLVGPLRTPSMERVFDA